MFQYQNDETNRNTSGTDSSLGNGGLPASETSENGKGRTGRTSEADREQSRESNELENNGNEERSDGGRKQGNNDRPSESELLPRGTGGNRNQRSTDANDLSKADQNSTKRQDQVVCSMVDFE